MPVKILMPALSPTMTEGKLSKWLKGEGDKVKSGDVLAEIETDKATMEVEAVDEGTLGKILVQAGTEGVAVNTTIALLLGEGEKASDLKETPTDTPKTPNGKTPSPVPSSKNINPIAAAKPQPTLGSSMTTSSPHGELSSRIFASPLARRLAADAGVDLSKVRGSGPHGRIIKADIEAAGSGKGGATRGPVSQPTTAGALPFEPAFELQPLSMMRKTIARRLTESKQQVPHYYLTVEVCLDALLDARTKLNSLSGDAGKLSVNDMLIKILAVALNKHPDCNVSYTDEGIKKYASVDVAVAVAIPGGLITPVIRGADQKGLAQISADMRDLAGKAKSGKLMPEEYQGGTFSLSNLGMFGIREFIAVINPPQAGILAVGAGEQRAIVRDGQVVVATMMMATLSADHRAIDGATGAQMLKTFKNLVENPVAMIL